MLKVFCVYDNAIDAYTNPFFMKSKGEAIRSFSDVCNDEKSHIYAHPDDYTLFELGDYDESTGVITPCSPRSLGVAIEFKRSV